MTKVIEVDQSKTRCDVDSVNDYVNLLNGIAYACKVYDEYDEGNRNNVAVDLTVASYMLGLPALDVLSEFERDGLIDPANDDEDPVDRVNRVLDYFNSFCWDWMINPDEYVSIADRVRVSENHPDMLLFFKLV